MNRRAVLLSAAILAAAAVLLYLNLGKPAPKPPPPPEPTELESLVAGLKADQMQDRRRAAQELGKLGTKAEEAVPALCAALEDANPFVRADAAEALGAIRRRAGLAVPALAKALRRKDENDKQWLLRRQAARSLGAFGPEAKDAVPALAALLRGKDNATQGIDEVVPEALARIGKPAVPVLIEALRSPPVPLAGRQRDEEVRHLPVIQALGRIGPYAAEAVPELSRLLMSKDSGLDHRMKAVEAARALGRLGPSAAAPLAEAMSMPGEQAFRFAIRQSLHALGKDAVPALVKALGAKSAETRRRAAEVLGDIGPAASAAREALRAAAESEGDHVRDDAVAALIELGDWDPAFHARHLRRSPDLDSRSARLLAGLGAAAVPALVLELEAGDRESRVAAARLLAGIGEAARPALLSLEAMLADKDELLRAYAAQALARLGDEGIAALAAFAPGKDRNIRLDICNALAGVGKGLAKFAADTDPEVRRCAIRGLARAGSDLPALVAALRDPDEEARRCARSAFLDRAPLPEAFASALGAALAHGDPSMREEAARLLLSAGKAARPAKAALRKVLGDSRPAVRRLAAMALTRSGAEAGATIPVHLEALNERAGPEPNAGDHVRDLLLLGEAGEAALLKALREQPSRRWRAARGLPSVEPEKHRDRLKDAIPALVAGLKDGKTRHAAASALAWFGPLGKEAVPALLEHLPSGGDPNEANILHAIRETGGSLEPALPLLLRILKDPRAKRDDDAAWLALLGPKAAAAIPDLVAHLAALRFAPAALSAIGPAAIPALKPALRDLRAAYALAALGSMGEAALPVLEECLFAKEEISPDGLRQQLVRIGKPAVPLLRRVLAMPPDDRRAWLAVGALGQMGEAARPAVPDLVAALEKPSLRYLALLALRDLGPVAVDATSALEKQAKEAEPRERSAALEALAAMAEAGALPLARFLAQDELTMDGIAAMGRLMELGAKAKPAREGLLAQFKDASPGKRLRAAIVLARQGAVPEAVVAAYEAGLKDEASAGVALSTISALGAKGAPLVTGAMRHPAPGVREAAIRALLTFDPPPKEAVPALLAARLDAHRSVRGAARDALARIAPAEAWKPLR